MRLWPLLWTLACATGAGAATGPGESPPPAGELPEANVVSVAVSGDEGAYTFNVGVASDETGCEQYADWWEVVALDGALVYRRILAHSHPDEQPFVRSGGPIDVSADANLVLRAHLNSGGYGSVGLSGSVESGFLEFSLDPAFSADLVSLQPLPDGCLF